MYMIMLVLWIIFNGRCTMDVLIFGVIFCGAIYYFSCKTLGYGLKRGAMISKSVGLFFKYLIILVFEITKSSLQTMNLILLHSTEIRPKTLRLHVDLTQEGSRILLANTITLTPGTLTINLNENELIIHVLDGRQDYGFKDLVFIKLLTAMEEKINDSI